MHRLFIALRPPPAIRAHLISLMGGVVDARWQSDEQLHITLRFLGDVDARRAEDVVFALQSVRQAPFNLSLRGVDVFTRKGRVTTLWAGVTPHSELKALHKKLDQAMVRIGLPAEARAYQPHVTLARFSNQGGDSGAFVARHADLNSAPFAVNQFALFESRLGKGGAHYENIARYPLG